MPDRTLYDAARARAVLLDRPARGRLWTSGPDRLGFLQGLLTNDVKALAAGGGCYAAYLTPQGRMITDMRLYELGDGLLMTLPAPLAAAVRDRLDALVFSEDVKIEDRTGAWAQLGLHGPAAAGALARALATAPDAQAERFAALRPFQHARLPFGEAGADVVAAATDELGGGGFDLFVGTKHAPALRDALLAAGAIAAGPDVAEVLRVEAGCPEFGVDMDESTIPLEAGIEGRAISFTKGCYVGQEVIIRVVHRGQGRVARRLVGLTIGDGGGAPRVPAIGATLHAENREAGRITSAVWSPSLERAIAMGYVHRDFAEPATRLLVAHAGAHLSAVVTKTPFVSEY